MLQQCLTITNAYNNRGSAYVAKGQYDTAITDYNKAIKLNPQYAEAYFNKASSCDKLGYKSEAIQAYKLFIRYAPPTYSSYIEKVKQQIRTLGGTI